MKDTGEDPVHWTRQKEQSSGYWHLKFLLILYRIFPLIVLRILAFPVGFFYFLVSKKARSESRRFLKKAAPFAKDPKTAKKCLSVLGPLRHIISFSLSLVERLQSWGGRLSFSSIHFHDDDVGKLVETLDKGQGVFLLTSHLGNMELLRALVNYNRTNISREVPVTAILNMKVSENFNRLLKELNPESTLDVIGADGIGPDTAVLLEEKLGLGHMVTIAGDRTSAGNSERNILFPFLGEEAPFQSGVFYLATLMKAPVFFIFALRRGNLSIRPEYDIHVHTAGASLAETRKERTKQSLELARSFVAHLESYCKETPFQWYNFYDFWSKGA